MMELLLLLFAVPGIFMLADFLAYLLVHHRIVGNVFSKIFELAIMIGLPFLFLSLMDGGEVNDCCNDVAFFSPPHRFTAYLFIFICLAAYFYSSYRSTIGSPVLEILTNSLLLAGIIFNIFVAIQEGSGFWIIGNIPIIICFVNMLIKNQQLIVDYFNENNMEAVHPVGRFCLSILRLHPLLKTPLLLVICLPVLVILTCVLLLFGQKPDSMIRAFTDTYHHGLSQWNYMCNNVECGGHYLCSVAAKGHKKIVKPQRLGFRAGELIVCNRQLLVSNAFEELLEHKCPSMHRIIRKNYNHIGDFVHRYYWVFNIKWVSDVIYILMKPLEWFFVLVLYTLDKQPENRIAVQYLSKQDRQILRQKQYKNKAVIVLHCTNEEIY